MENWIETDNRQDAIISLEMVGHYLERKDNNVHNWKWIIIGLHNALQGFMVLALFGSNPLNIMNDKEAHNWQEAYEHGRPLPDYHL
ncbi:MAG: hypothetical protein WA110_05360 [Anaerolineaceae bacterium]